MDNDSLRLLIAALTSLIFTTWAASVWTALAALTRGRLRRLDAGRQAEVIAAAEHWLDHRERYRLTIRVFTLSGIASGATLSSHMLSDNAIIPCAIWGIVYLGLSELAGGWGIRHPWRLLSISMPIVRIATAILAPVILPLHALTQVFAHRDATEDGEKPSTADEIVSLVEQDAQQEKGTGDLEDTERRMILGVMDLDETYVKEIMTPRVDICAIDSKASIADLKQRIIESGHSRIPVFRNTIDDIIGIVYSRDLHDEKRLAALPNIRPLLHQPVFVPETKAVSELLEELKQRKVHLAVIIDEYGGTAGIVTIEDILEEIVGEIRDEYDHDEEDLLCEMDGSGVATVDARVPVDRINTLLNATISLEEDFDTIGGYIASELGRIPKNGEEFTFGELKCRILTADQRKISRIQLSRAASGE